MPKKLISLKVEDADHEAWKKAANKAGVGLSEWIRKNCDDVAHGVVIELRSEENANRNGKDVRGVSRVPVVAGSAPGPDTRSDAVAAVDLAAVAEQTKSRRISDSSIESAVASRTGHPVGHECFDCVQTYRFIKQQRDIAEKEEPKKKGRR
jgi:hypothetical protein